MLANGSYFLLFSGGAAVCRWRYLRGYLRFAALFVLVAALGEGASYVTARILRMPNLWMLHVYTIVEFNVIALMYDRFFGRFYQRLLVPVSMLLFTTLAVANSLFAQHLSEHNTHARTLESLLIIGLTLLAFHKLLADRPVAQLERHPVFWISTGLLLYFAGSTIFFILSNRLLHGASRDVINVYWAMHSLLMALMHLLLGIGLWLSPQAAPQPAAPAMS